MDSSGDVEQGGEEEALEHDETEPDGPNQADTEPANNADASAGGAGGVSYQIQMRNLPTKASEQDVRAACAGFELSRVKKAKKWNYAFVTFKSKEDRDRAMEKLADVSVKGQQVQLESIDDTWRPNANGTGNAQRGRRGMKKSRNEAAPDDSRTPQERLADQVTPLWRMPYAQQLAEKTKVARDVLVGVRKSLKELAPAGASTMQWLDDGVLVASGLPCPLLDIVPSPIETHYRTKCEFSFGVDPWGKQTLGFLLGLVKDGYTADASECLHVSEAALRIRSVMQEYADGHEWKAYDRIDKTGTWRLLVVKTFWSGENQAIVQINPSGMSRERLDEEKRLLAEFFERKISAGEVELKSLMWQEWDGVFNGFTDKEPLVDLIGDGYVHEDLCGLRFRVSPNAFFQVNTPATEKLYGIVREWCGLSPDRDTTLLDLCCGTGTIGLTMAKVARRIVGVELSADAVRDAAINAEVNGLREGEDVEYICARVEDALAGVFGKLKGGEKVVAVLDPPREGVHPSVTKAIRNCADLKQLVYVACNPAAASRNFIDLCRPTADKFPGRPFRMTKAVPVDLFPQTKLVEVVVFFERD
ncbi:S-adenosyl-L-methionine-dependent methyltransferase [Hyaloraphidium curvatum]|nr:S-adenosyl-L-methionine-dependent methyltransferase [Hyaloraphidium curvatum]